MPFDLPSVQDGTAQTADQIRAREAAILDHLARNDYTATWAVLTATSPAGHVVQLEMMADALQIGGVRVNLSAAGAQAAADALGCLLPTPKIADLLFLTAKNRGPILLPSTQMITSTTQAMVDHSARIDAALARLGPLPPPDDGAAPVQTVGKHWVITNGLLAHPGRACNYGWHVAGVAPRSRWAGIYVDYAVTPGLGVVQAMGFAHDPSHVDYCLDPSTRVLTADLRWVPIGDLQVGDRVIGFDEGPGWRQSWLQPAAVESVTFREEECYAVETDKVTVIASGRHRWPIRGDRGMPTGKRRLRNRINWTETQSLEPGDRIPYFCDPWVQDTSWDGAWMAGFLDGEGWLSDQSFGFGQNEGELLNRAVALCEKHGFHPSFSPNQKTPKGNTCIKVYVPGQRSCLRMLGIFRPIRLMAKSEKAWVGTLAACGARHNTNVSHAKILRTTRVGKRTVVGIKTSTGTFIAEGLLSHNSQIVQLVHGRCKVDGADYSTADALTDADLSGALSHEGPLRVLRQPGTAAGRQVADPGGTAGARGFLRRWAAPVAGGALGFAAGGPPGAALGFAAGLGLDWGVDAVQRSRG